MRNSRGTSLCRHPKTLLNVKAVKSRGPIQLIQHEVNPSAHSSLLLKVFRESAEVFRLKLMSSD